VTARPPVSRLAAVDDGVEATMPNIPRLEIVKRTAVISSRVNVPPRARRASSRVSAPIWAGDLDSAARTMGVMRPLSVATAMQMSARG